MAKRGPKPKYKQDYDQQAYVACTKGLIDLDLAELFGICEKTLYKWQEKYESFRVIMPVDRETDLTHSANMVK